MITPKELQEHGQLTTEFGRYEKMQLVSWTKPTDRDPWGYYASFKIGAEWVKEEKEAIVVSPKKGMENIDFVKMFMTCFSSDLAFESFQAIYSIDVERPVIPTKSLQSVVSPLIVAHLLGVVSRIKALKKGYTHHSENLKKVKGHVNVLKNERKNIIMSRYDMIYCEYDEYSVDIPENRLIKKALRYSSVMIQRMGNEHASYNVMLAKLRKCIALFEGVGDEVQLHDIGPQRSHKLFAEYAESIRLSKLIISHFDQNLHNEGQQNRGVVPFVVDMSLLYEHYVYGLLYEAYGERVSYQFHGKTGYPDFLYRSNALRAILDTKYIPRLGDSSTDIYIVRQLSGYARDLRILRYLGYEDLDERKEIETVPCVLIYPKEGSSMENPFMNLPFENLLTHTEPNISKFYKVAVPLPIINNY